MRWGSVGRVTKYSAKFGISQNDDDLHAVARCLREELLKAASER